MPSLDLILAKYVAAVETDLRLFVQTLFQEDRSQLAEIFQYHLGLCKGNQKGKRIRSIFMLLCQEGSGGNWQNGVPAATAIELIHNFSLIHDDIEDNSNTRRGKMAVWNKWGLASGINSGDAMFVSAFVKIADLARNYSSDILQNANNLLVLTCFELTHGQQLDIEFEKRANVTSDQYLDMIGKKTGSLIACSCQIGALLSGLTEEDQYEYANFGMNIGLAFQVYDDWLGIWGDPKITGKSNVSDLLERKKTLPVILGFEESEDLRNMWQKKINSNTDAREFANELTNLGIEQKVLDQAQKFNTKSMRILEKMNCSNDIKKYLRLLSENLTVRKK